MTERVPLRVLLVEDSEDDALLLLRELKRGGYEPRHERVDTPEAMEAALRGADGRGEPWEIVLSDYYMPRFRAPEAISLLRGLGYDTPLIVVSGKIGEEAAVEAMRAGAQDYVTKGNLARLAPAIARELEEAEARREGREAGRRLREAELRYKTLVEQIPAITYVQDPFTKRTSYVSPQVEKVLGYPADRDLVDADHWVRIMHPEDRERVLAEDRRTDETGEPFRMEYRQFAADGSLVWIRDEAVLVRDEAGEPLYWQGVQYDVTEQKRTENELRNSEERYRTFIGQSTEGIWRFELAEPLPLGDPVADEARMLRHVYRHAHLAECNDAMARMYGYGGAEEILGARLEDFLPPSEPRNVEYLRAFMRSGFRLTDAETAEPDKAGSLRWFSNNLTGIVEDGKLVRAWGTQKDITEQKRAQRSLRESEERFRATFDQAAVGMMQVGLDGAWLRFNDKFAEITGYPREELEKVSVFDLIPVEEFAEDFERGVSMLAGEMSDYTEEKRIVGKDGRRVWIHLTVSLIHDAAGGPRYFMAVVEDISARKEAEEERDRFFTLSLDLLCIAGPDGRFRRVNPAFTQVLGYPERELLERPFLEFVHPEDRDKTLAEVERLMEGLPTLSFENRYRRKDGTFVWLSWKAVNVGGLTYAVARDETERKEAEEALRYSEARFRTMIEQSPLSIQVLSPDGRTLRVNRAWEEMWGTTMEGLGDYNLLQDAQLVEKGVMPYLLKGFGGEATEIPAIAYDPDESIPDLSRHTEPVRWVRAFVYPVKSEAGDIREVILMHEDITEQRHAEQELERLASFPRLNPNPVVEATAGGEITYANPVSEELFPDLLEKGGDHPFLSGLDEAEREILRRGARVFTREVRVGGDAGDAAADDAAAGESGGESYYQQTISRIPGSGLLRVYAVDVTERRRAEEAVRESERRFRSLVQNASDIIAILDGAGNITYESPTVEKVLGFTPEERVGVEAFSLVHPEDRERVVATFSEYVGKPGAQARLDYRIRDRDGSWHHFEAVATNLFHDPSVGGIVVNARDVTGRKRAEAGLRESEERFRATFEQAAVGVALVGVGGHILRANEKLGEILGYGPQELLGMTVRDITHPDDVEEDVTRVGRTLAGDYDTYRMEKRYVRKDGRVVWANVAASLVRDHAGEPAYFIGVVEDITERRQAEERIRESEARLQAILDSSTALVYVKDRSGRYLLTNRRFEELYHLRRDGALGKTDHDLFPEAAEDLVINDRLVLASGEPLEIEEVVPQDGVSRTYVSVKVPLVGEDGKPYAVCGVSTDITARKRAEEDLRAAEGRYRSLVEQIPAVIYLDALDERGSTIYVSPQVEALTGHRPEEYASEPGFWGRLLHPEDRERVLAAQAEAAAGAPFEAEYRFVAADGRVVWVRDESVVVRDGEGRPLYRQGVQTDITGRRQAEEALRQSEELYRSVVEQAAESIFVVDAKTKRILEANAALSRSLGYAPEELKEMTLYDIVAHDRDSVDENVARIMELGRLALGERRYLKKDGGTAEVEVYVSAISYGGGETGEVGKAMCVVAHDVTDRNRAEAALREAREAERVRIARELHDDILQDIVYALQEIQIYQFAPDDGAHDGGAGGGVSSRALEASAEALRRSVEGLRGAIFDLRLEGMIVYSLRSSVEALVDLNRRMSRGAYEVDLGVQEGFPDSVGEAVGREFVRVVQEALTNARRHAEPSRVRVTLGVQGDAAFAEVSDDGRGFDAERPRVGVGQESMRGRAREMGGSLIVESEPGRGTRVRLTVPLARLVGEEVRPG